uniref:EGF-like domain-containing protein n=1 Tax=Strongyloides venezuelensis TaxID=75913 RepID=A0A0K0FFV5_STRVS
MSSIKRCRSKEFLYARKDKNTSVLRNKKLLEDGLKSLSVSTTFKTSELSTTLVKNFDIKEKGINKKVERDFRIHFYCVMELPLRNIFLIFFQFHQFSVSQQREHYEYNCLDNIEHPQLDVVIGTRQEKVHLNTNNRQYIRIENHHYGYNYNGDDLKNVFNAENAFILQIDMSKFNYNVIVGKSKIFLMFCPNNKNDVHIVDPVNNYGRENLYVHYKYPRVCSLKICEIGIYYKPKIENIMESTIDDIVTFAKKDVYYVAFSNTEGRDIIFGTYVYDGHNYPLVPCPYTKWIPKNNLTKFTPSKYVEENGIQLNYDDNDRHRLVPGIPSSKDGTILYCGKISQHNLKEVNVGLKLKISSNSHTYNNFEITTTGVKCSDQIFSDHIFSYTPDNTIYNGDNGGLKKFNPSVDNIYSGQIMLIYKKDGLRNLNDVIKDGNISDEFFDSQMKINTICSGMVPDKEATLLLKINGKKVIYKMTYTGKRFVTIDTNSIENKILQVGCHVVLDNASDKRYKDFYSKRYKFLLFKTQSTTFNSSKNIDKIDISSTVSLRDIYGYYNCKIDNDKKNKKIKESEFILLPKKVINLIEPVETFSKTKNSFFCYKNYMDIGDLFMIKIELPSGIEFSNLNNSSSFTTNGSLVIFNNSSDYAKGVATLICEYNVIDQPFIILKKKLKPEDVVLENTTNGNLTRRSNDTINKSSNSASSVGLSTVLIVAIIAVSLIVITIIIAVTIIISLKLKNKKKKKNIDSLDSIDISKSGSSLSSTSKTTSQSISTFLKTKNSRSKLKVPIVLESLSDPSTSISISKSKALSKTPMSKVVSNERRVSKTK